MRNTIIEPYQGRCGANFRVFTLFTPHTNVDRHRLHANFTSHMILTPNISCYSQQPQCAHRINWLYIFKHIFLKTLYEFLHKKEKKIDGWSQKDVYTKCIKWLLVPSRARDTNSPVARVIVHQYKTVLLVRHRIIGWPQAILKIRASLLGGTLVLENTQCIIVSLSNAL